MEDVPQLPVAADHGGGQAGAVGQGDAHPFQINTDQLLRAHLLGQRGGHIVPVAAIQELHPVDLLCPQGGETGGRGQQVILYLARRDILQRQLPGLQPPLFHGDKAEPDGRSPQGILIQHPLHDLFQRGHVHAAVPHHFPQEGVQLREVGVFLRQLHHVLAADAHPHIPGRFVQVQRKHGTVQAAHTGAGDDLGPPAQLGQGTPHTHLIAAARTAACQHQCLDRGIILCHLERLLVILWKSVRSIPYFPEKFSLFLEQNPWYNFVNLCETMVEVKQCTATTGFLIWTAP